MKPVLKSFQMFLKQVTKDGMLIMSVFAPILAAMFFKWGIPIIESFLTDYYHQESIIRNYYVLIDLLLATLTPFMFCFVASMTMLDEYDNHIINHLSITPMRKKGYLLSRLVIPSIFAFIYSIFILILFSLSDWSFYMIVIVSLLTSLMSISQSLLVFSFSKNKVEGIAVSKLSGIIMMGLFIPFFIKSNTQYFFIFLPSLWIAKLRLESSFIHFIFALLISTLWISILYHKFDKKLSS